MIKQQIRIATVLGARPQFVKAAVVSRALARIANIAEVIIHTGQHFDANMSEVFFDELSIRQADYNLGIHRLNHGAMTGRMMEAIENVLMELHPDVVLVYGDTDSTLAGALAAAKLHIPVAHVEAGLRAFNKAIPEEINRVVADHLSEFLFTPTDQADANLKSEGIRDEHIYHVGDVMYDAALQYADIATTKSTILKDHKLAPKSFFLATIHRPQNTDTKEVLQHISNLLESVANEAPVVWPVHPRSKKQLTEFGITLKHVKCIDPIGYLDMIELERNANLIITDSGGVQKEAYFHRVPCVTLKTETEWVELIEQKWNILMPPSGDIESMKSIIFQRTLVKGNDCHLYGGGNASEKIAEILTKRFVK